MDDRSSKPSAAKDDPDSDSGPGAAPIQSDKPIGVAAVNSIVGATAVGDRSSATGTVALTVNRVDEIHIYDAPSPGQPARERRPVAVFESITVFNPCSDPIVLSNLEIDKFFFAEIPRLSWQPFAEVQIAQGPPLAMIAGTSTVSVRTHLRIDLVGAGRRESRYLASWRSHMRIRAKISNPRSLPSRSLREAYIHSSSNCRMYRRTLKALLVCSVCECFARFRMETSVLPIDNVFEAWADVRAKRTSARAHSGALEHPLRERLDPRKPADIHEVVDVLESGQFSTQLLTAVVRAVEDVGSDPDADAVLLGFVLEQFLMQSADAQASAIWNATLKHVLTMVCDESVALHDDLWEQIYFFGRSDDLSSARKARARRLDGRAAALPGGLAGGLRRR